MKHYIGSRDGVFIAIAKNNNGRWSWQASLFDREDPASGSARTLTGAKVASWRAAGKLAKHASRGRRGHTRAEHEHIAQSWKPTPARILHWVPYPSREVVEGQIRANSGCGFGMDCTLALRGLMDGRVYALTGWADRNHPWHTLEMPEGEKLQLVNVTKLRGLDWITGKGRAAKQSGRRSAKLSWSGPHYRGGLSRYRYGRYLVEGSRGSWAVYDGQHHLANRTTLTAARRFVTNHATGSSR